MSDVSDPSLYLTGAGVPSAEAVGSPAVNAEVDPAGVASAFSSGAPGVQSQIVAAGIPSAYASGSPAVQAQIVAAGVPSAFSVGAPTVGGAVIAAGVPSAEVAGLPDVSAVIAVAGAVSAESVGSPTVGEVVIPDMPGGGSKVLRGGLPIRGFRHYKEPPKTDLSPPLPHVILVAGAESAFVAGLPTVVAEPFILPPLPVVPIIIPDPELLPAPAPVLPRKRRRKAGERQLLGLSIAFADELGR